MEALKKAIKGISLAHKGFESSTAAELKKLKAKPLKEGSGWVCFEAKDLKHLCSIAYLSAASTKVLAQLKVIKSNSLDSLIKGISSAALAAWMTDNTKFRVTCSSDKSETDKIQVSQKVGAAIVKNCKKLKLKVDLESPEIIIHIEQTGSEWLAGVDLTGINTSTRDYKLFLLSTAPKGTIAANLLLHAGYQGKGIIIDPFCRGGVIAIEAAAMLAGHPINSYRKGELAFTKLPRNPEFSKDSFFDYANKMLKAGAGSIYAYSEQFREIAGAKKNAKIANLLKFINFSRLEVDWIDTKFDRKSIDHIVTIPPQASKNRKISDATKLAKELLEQADYCLKNKGSLVVMLRDPKIFKSAIERLPLKIQDERIIRHGKAQQHVLKIVRK